MQNEFEAMTGPEEENEGMDSFQDLLDAYDYDMPKRGQLLEGIVVQANDDEVILDVGLKHDAIVPRDDLERLDDETRSTLVSGAEVSVFVVNPQNANGDLIVSVYRALSLEDWEKARQLLEEDAIIDAEVVDTNRGGLLVQFGRLRGFVPQSLTGNPSRSPSARSKRAMVGKMLNLKVIEVNQQRNRLVFSEKAALEDARKDKIQELEVGQTLTGRVVSLVDYGAFVDIGGIDGLIHISKLDWQHVTHPKEVLDVGDEVEVQIDDIDIERERISLNRKVLMPSPWETLTARYSTGQLATGTVTNVVDFGVFVEIESNIEGLVHISEMSNFGSDPYKLVRKGDEIPVRIISIEPDRQRIGLSMDKVTAEEQREWLSNRGRTEDEEQDTADEYEVEEVEAEAQEDESATQAEEVPTTEAEAEPVAEAEEDAPAAEEEAPVVEAEPVAEASEEAEAEVEEVVEDEAEEEPVASEEDED